MKRENFTIGGEVIKPGEQKRLQLQMPPLYTDTSMGIPVFVQHGKRAGPTLFVSAAIHGDELNGIEIVSRLIKTRAIKNIRGTLIAIPMAVIYLIEEI
jgi:predicted deacylase